MGEMITPPMESAITEVAHYYRQLAEKKRSRAEAQGHIQETNNNQDNVQSILSENIPEKEKQILLNLVLYHLKLRICLNNNGKSSDCTKWKFVSSKIEHFLNILITLTVMKRHVQKNLSNTTCFLPMDTIITWKILKNRQDSLQVRKIN